MIEVDSITYLLIQLTGFITILKTTNLLAKQIKRMRKMKNPFKKPFNDIPYLAYVKWAKLYKCAYEAGLVK